MVPGHVARARAARASGEVGPAGGEREISARIARCAALSAAASALSAWAIAGSLVSAWAIAGSVVAAGDGGSVLAGSCACAAASASARTSAAGICGRGLGRRG